MENKCPCLRCKEDDNGNKVYYCMDDHCSSKHKLLACPVINMNSKCRFLKTCKHPTEYCSGVKWAYPLYCSKYESNLSYYRNLEREDDYKSGRRPKYSIYSNPYITGKVVDIKLEAPENGMYKVVMHLDTGKSVTTHVTTMDKALKYCYNTLNNHIWVEKSICLNRDVVYALLGVPGNSKKFEPV